MGPIHLVWGHVLVSLYAECMPDDPLRMLADDIAKDDSIDFFRVPSMQELSYHRCAAEHDGTIIIRGTYFPTKDG